jgi:hypothetical protein
MLMGNLLGVDGEVHLAKHMLKLYPLPVCDLFAPIHFEFVFIVLDLVN